MRLPLVLTAVAAILTNTLAARDLFAFDNGLKDLKTPAGQAELLARLGYSGIGSRPGDTAGMLAALDRHNLKMIATYVSLTANMKSCPVPPAVASEIDALKGRDTIVWLTVSGKSTDEVVVPAVREVADIAARNKLKVALYPHADFHTDTDAAVLRIMRLADRPNIGVSFNLCHFLKQTDEAALEKTLRAAAPHLMLVSLNGSDSGDTRSMNWDRLIQPLGEGTYPVRKLLRLLDEIGYKGPVGLQCFQIPLPAADHLAKSMRAWRTLAGGTPTETLTAFKEAAQTKDLEATWKHAAKFEGIPDDVTQHLKGEVKDFIDLTARGWDFEIMEEKIDGDCAVVMINEHKKEGRKAFDIDPIFLIRQEGEWMVFPDLTDWDIAKHVAKDKIDTYTKLEEWFDARKIELKKQHAQPQR